MRILCSILILLAASPVWAADAPKRQLPFVADMGGPVVECVFLFETAGVPSSTPGDCRVLQKWQPSQVGVLLAQATWGEATIVQATLGAAGGSEAAAASSCGANEAQIGDACDPLDAGVLRVLGAGR